MSDGAEKTFVIGADGELPAMLRPKSWGRLLSFAPGSYPNVELDADVTWLGRSKDLPDAHRVNSRVVSNKHLLLTRKGDETWLLDQSTNGTYVNRVLVGKGKSVKIVNGDEVALHDPAVATEPDAPVPHYAFHDTTTPADTPSDAAMATDDATQVTPVVSSTLKRSHSEATKDDEPISPSKPPAVAVPPAAAAAGAAGAVAASASAAADAPAAKKKKDDEELLENLMCGICHEILYKAVTLVPCQHIFCGCCYSDWKDRSSDCPSCRTRVNHLAVNHTVNSLVTAFLKIHPEYDRDPEDKKDMDARSKITADMLAVKRKRYDPDDDDDDDGSDGSGSDDDDGNGPVPGCNDCINMTPGAFRCAPGQAHLRCSACFNPFPNRAGDPTVQQTCTICHQPFCQFYSGHCMALNAADRFRKLKDHTFTDLPAGWPGCFRGNTYERDILKSYLTDNGISFDACYADCLDGFLKGDFKIAPGGGRMVNPGGLTPESNACRECVSILFGELVYDYRKAIPRDKLPAAVTNRKDCWYGRNCRTQINPNNPQHRVNLNHICDQVKR